MTREYTNKILELMDEGVLDPKLLVQDLLSWMSEYEVSEFYDTTLREAVEYDDED